VSLGADIYREGIRIHQNKKAVSTILVAMPFIVSAL